jgi:hypothetical protein
MAIEASTWGQVLLDPDTGKKMCFTPTKTLVCAPSKVLLCFHQSTWLRLQIHPNPILGPITPGLGLGLGLGGQDLIKLTTGKVHYVPTKTGLAYNFLPSCTVVSVD